MQLDDIVIEVRDTLGTLVSDSYQTEVAITRAINRALRWYQTGLPLENGYFPWLAATETTAIAISDASIPLPSDCHSVISVVLSGEDELIRVRPQELDAVVDDDIASDTPVFWAIDGTDIKFVPAALAAGAIVVRYVTEDPALVAGNDVPLLPERHVGILIEHAAYTSLRRDRRTDEATVALQAANDAFASARSEAVRLSPHRTVLHRPGGFV